MVADRLRGRLVLREELQVALRAEVVAAAARFQR
jgi:hypothetical protein